MRLGHKVVALSFASQERYRLPYLLLFVTICSTRGRLGITEKGTLTFCTGTKKERKKIMIIYASPNFWNLKCHCVQHKTFSNLPKNTHKLSSICTLKIWKASEKFFSFQNSPNDSNCWNGIWCNTTPEQRSQTDFRPWHLTWYMIHE